MVDGQAATAPEATEGTSSASGDTDTSATNSDQSTAETSTPAESEGASKPILADDGDGKGDGDVGTEEKTESEDVTADGETTAEDESTESDDEAEAKEEPEAEAKKPDDEPAKDEETEDAEAKEDGDDTGLPDDFDWRTLATDEKNRNKLSHFNSVDEVAEALRDADAFKRRAVLVPNSKSPPEEIAKFQKAIGVPDSPEGYEIEIHKDADDGVKSRVERLQMTAHSANLTPKQLDVLVQWHESEQQAMAQQEEQAIQDFRNQVKTDLSREWGADFQRNSSVAAEFAKEAFGGYAEDFLSMKLEDGTLIGDHPIFVKGMAKQARRFGEAGIPGEIAPADWMPTESDLIKMQEEPGYRDGTDKDLIKRVTEGYRRLYPG